MSDIRYDYLSQNNAQKIICKCLDRNIDREIVIYTVMNNDGLCDFPGVFTTSSTVAHAIDFEHSINCNSLWFTLSTKIFYRGVPGFATDCPCGVWCRGLTTCPLYVGPLFGNLVQNDSRFVSLTQGETTFLLFLIVSHLNALQYNALFSFTLLPCL